MMAIAVSEARSLRPARPLSATLIIPDSLPPSPRGSGRRRSRAAP
jgi:hypothetical protein